MAATLREVQSGVLALSGAVDAQNCNQLRTLGRQLLAASAADTCVVDFHQVTHGGSFCLSLLLCWWRDAHALGKKLLIWQLSPELQQMARLYGLDDVLPLEA